MPTFKNQKQYSEREKTVFWPQKKYFVKNNEGEGANCIAANLSFKKSIIELKKAYLRWSTKSFRPGSGNTRVLGALLAFF